MRRKTTKILLAVTLVLTAVALPGTASTAATAAAQHGHTHRPKHRLDRGHHRNHTWHSERDGDVHLHLRGDGHADIDVHVYDEHGREVARDNRSSHNCDVEFHAESEENYTFKVVNHGNQHTHYELWVESD